MTGADTRCAPRAACRTHLRDGGGAGDRPRRARPDALRRGPRREPREGGARAWRRRRGRGARIVCLPGAVPLALPLPERGRGALRLGRADSRAVDRGARARWRRRCGVAIVASLFERRARGPLPQHRGDARRRGPHRGALPQDAHPRRPALLREVLLHARRPRLPVARRRAARASATLVCWDQWFPEAARLAALGGAQILFYPTAIGWQFDEGEAVDARAARRLGDDPARPRDRERRLRGRR